MKFHDTELKIMDVLWREGDVPARQIAEVVGAQTGWNINTTYTMIKRMIAKGAIERREPHFICHALISPVRWFGRQALCLAAGAQASEPEAN